MTDNEKTPLVSFKYGTPEPVTFRETMGTDYFEEEMQARTAMNVNVYEYDAEKYGTADELVTALKNTQGIKEMMLTSMQSVSGTPNSFETASRVLTPWGVSS